MQHRDWDGLHKFVFRGTLLCVYLMEVIHLSLEPFILWSDDRASWSMVKGCHPPIGEVGRKLVEETEESGDIAQRSGLGLASGETARKVFPAVTMIISTKDKVTDEREDGPGGGRSQ